MNSHGTKLFTFPNANPLRGLKANIISRLRLFGPRIKKLPIWLGMVLAGLLVLAGNAHSTNLTDATQSAVQPDAVQPDAAQPDAAQPDAVQPDAAQPTQSQRIEQAVHGYLSEQYRDHSVGRLDIAIDSPDDRLNLAPCEAPLDVTTRLGQRRYGRVTLSVSCPEGDRWSIYVAATVRAFDSVVVAHTPIPRGSAISTANLSLEEKDITFLHQGYFREIHQVAGSTANRPLSSGRVITPAQVSPPQIVNRGERVIIVASNTALSIRAPGVALSDGALGELIQVRNSSSNRVIEGRVSAPGTISVSF